MKGLILKDLYNLKKYSRTVAAIIVFYIVFFGVFGNQPAMIAGMSMLMIVMMSITSFAYDDAAHWDRYALSLPVTRKDVVRSKYLLSLLLCGIGMVLSAAVSVAVSLIKQGSVTETLLTLLGCLLLSLLYVAVLLPIIFKFGSEKSRIWMMLVFAVPMAVFFLLSYAGVGLPTEETVIRALFISPAIIVALFVLSYRLSCRIYAGKEF